MATTVVNPPIAESTTADVDIKTFSEGERQAWRKTGELPQRGPKTQEESSPSQDPSEAAGKTEQAESAPAPEAGRNQEQPPKRDNAQTRIKELLAANKRLEAELAKRQNAETKAAPSTATAETDAAAKRLIEQSQPLNAPKKPEQKDFESWEKYDEAREKYFEDLADYKAQLAVQKAEQQKAERAGQEKFLKQVEEGRQKYKDFDTVIQPTVQAIYPDQQINGTIKYMINQSPVLMDLLYVLGSDKAKLNEFVQTAKSDPARAIRELVIIEDLVMKELAGSGKNTPAKGPDGKFLPSTPEKQITRAPAPPTEVSGRGTPPADEVERAVKSEDQGAYARAANARDLARRRQGK